MDEALLKSLIDEYGNDILRLCFLYLKDYQLAEDAMQDTFISVFQKYDQFHERSNIKTWIIRIAINQCKMLRRKNFFKKERNNYEEVLQLCAEQYPYEQTENDFTVTTAVMNLSIKEREAIIAFYYQELSIKEGAKALGISESAFSQRLKRGREHLKEELKGTVVL